MMLTPFTHHKQILRLIFQRFMQSDTSLHCVRHGEHLWNTRFSWEGLRKGHSIPRGICSTRTASLAEPAAHGRRNAPAWIPLA